MSLVGVSLSSGNIQQIPLAPKILEGGFFSLDYSSGLDSLFGQFTDY
jgi:hypothetical protein